jgi:hypothetical protein
LDLHAAKRSRIEKSAVFACEWHSLRNALVDYVKSDLGEAVHVRLARAKVAALHRVVKEAENAVAVIAVVLRGIDPSLRSDGVRTAWGVVIGLSVHQACHHRDRNRHETHKHDDGNNP